MTKPACNHPESYKDKNIFYQCAEEEMTKPALSNIVKAKQKIADLILLEMEKCPQGKGECFINEIFCVIDDLLSSELQAVLGEEKSELAKKPFGEDKEYDNIAIAEMTFNIGYNSHLQSCLKIARERGINL